MRYLTLDETLTMFGYTEQQIAQFRLTYGVGVFMLYVVFIILQLARESKTDRFGTFILLLDPSFGLHLMARSHLS